MNFFFVFFAFVLCIQQTVFAQIKINGTCPAICKPHELKVNISDLAGIWYLKYSTPYVNELTSSCTYTKFTVDGKKLKFSKFFTKRGTVYQEDGTKELTEAGDSTNHYSSVEFPYAVMTSKFVAITPKFTVKIACHECGVYGTAGSGMYIKIHTRLPFPDCEDIDEAIKVIKDCGIDEKLLVEQDLTTCNKCQAKPVNPSQSAQPSQSTQPPTQPAKTTKYMLPKPQGKPNNHGKKPY